MYVIDDKVFLHMAKAAGISVHTAAIQQNKKIDLNLRHFGVDYLPEKYKNLPRYGVIRKPEDWYKSFYNFFLNVHGYMLFMLNDPKYDVVVQGNPDVICKFQDQIDNKEVKLHYVPRIGHISATKIRQAIKDKAYEFAKKHVSDEVFEFLKEQL